MMSIDRFDNACQGLLKLCSWQSMLDNFNLEGERQKKLGAIPRCCSNEATGWFNILHLQIRRSSVMADAMQHTKNYFIPLPKQEIR